MSEPAPFLKEYSSWPPTVREEFDSGRGRLKRLLFIMRNAGERELKIAAAAAVLAAMMQDEARRAARAR